MAEVEPEVQHPVDIDVPIADVPIADPAPAAPAVDNPALAPVINPQQQELEVIIFIRLAVTKVLLFCL